ncbi:hypothetical protein [Komagataeibacter nataicola]|uniref:hypothetical protein n=1 Tax=Komagataeibacter nataicola TaxID=265960 RepID=UPI0038D06055
MTGEHLKMTAPQDILTARDVLEYHSREHMSVARGNATMTTNDGRQIRADVLVGYDKPKTQRTNKRKEWRETHPNGRTPCPTTPPRRRKRRRMTNPPPARARWTMSMPSATSSSAPAPRP